MQELTRNYVENPVGDYEAEYRLRHRDGSYRWIHSRGRIYHDPEGQPWRMMGSHVDVTERRTLEENLRALAAHLQTVRDQEAERIARELHDELGARLTGMKLDLAWLDRRVTRLLSPNDATGLRERLRAMTETIDETVRSVRKVCRDLRPGVLDELGFAAAIEWQAGEFQTRTGIHCRLSMSEPLEVRADHATALFRILQELLTNVTRHAKAAGVRIEVRQGAGEITMEVADDGCGMPEDALTRRDRFGLMGLRERVLAAGGNVEFLSAPGQGTRVFVRFPIS
jgi:signal transduction histidine kinase